MQLVSSWGGIMAEIKGIIRPPMRMPQELQGQRSSFGVRKPRKVEVPLLITLFGWYCVFRCVADFTFAFVMGLKPDTPSAIFIAKHFDPVPPPIPAEAAFFALGALYAVVAWRWLTRDWRARWAAMFISGATVASIAINLLADHAAGDPTPMSPQRYQATIVAVVMNLVICCYLAFYPGMNDAFRETPWE
jgi:hypothetical protein